jgi:hypothetical protein
MIADIFGQQAKQIIPSVQPRLHVSGLSGAWTAPSAGSSPRTDVFGVDQLNPICPWRGRATCTSAPATAPRVPRAVRRPRATGTATTTHASHDSHFRRFGLRPTILRPLSRRKPPVRVQMGEHSGKLNRPLGSLVWPRSTPSDRQGKCSPISRCRFRRPGGASPSFGEPCCAANRSWLPGCDP